VVAPGAGGMTEWPEVLQRGCALVAHEGEERSGDKAVFVPFEGGALVAVIDGLGHGDAAAEAAEVAAEVLREHAQEAPQALLERCHAALRKTRGAVMTLAWFDLRAHTMTWTGVGNVEARIVRADGARQDGPVVLGGVVGYQIPQVRMATVGLRPGDAVMFATDGVDADFTATSALALSAQEQAERILEQHGKGTDDALAVVVRYAP
jgi:negative regulator of sigma-B (phosphoserine phosphatase)